MRLAGVRRNGANQDGMEVGFAWIGGMDRLDELVTNADFVVVSVPLTPATRGLFDRARLARFKANASLVNVGRGGVIDGTALLEALDAAG